MTCPKCGGPMKIIDFITEYAVVDRIIDHLKLKFMAAKPPPSHILIEVALMEAGVPMPRSIHDLRHTAAQEMIRAGEDLATVQGWLRHRYIKSTQSYIDNHAKVEVEKRIAVRTARFL
jgi:integrase